VQQEATTIYSTFVVDSDMEGCFLLSHDTRHSPRNNAPPLVLFLSSTLPAQFASVYAVNMKSYVFGYHNPKSKVPLRYLKIILTAFICVSLGAY
jgi:hypothetical protein